MASARAMAAMAIFLLAALSATHLASSLRPGAGAVAGGACRPSGYLPGKSHSACSLPSRTMQPSQASSTVNCLRRHGRPPQDAVELDAELPIGSDLGHPR
uniref:Uncharacterized protein n=1 Tax=Oryza glumipatula TaxID=40148 RepID=A0A0E0BC28_9ORYZ